MYYLLNNTQITKLNFALIYDDNEGRLMYIDEEYGLYDKCFFSLDETKDDDSNWNCLVTGIKIGTEIIRYQS